VTTVSRTGGVLRRMVRMSCRRPRRTVALSLLLAAVGLAYTFHALTFETSTRALLPQSAGYVVRYAEYSRDFGELEDIVVVVEAGSFEAARAYGTRLAEELRASGIAFNRVAYRVDPKQFEGRQLLYLSAAELRQIRDKIFDHQEFMERFAGDPSLARLLEGSNAQITAAFVSNLFDLGLHDEDLPVDTRFLSTLLDQMSSRLTRPAPYRSPWGAFFSLGGDPPADAGYFLSEDESLLFILVETPQGRQGSFVGDQAAIEVIRAASARLRPSFPGVQAGVTGGPALSNDEMSAAFRDSEMAAVLAFALTLVVMTVAFRRPGKPLLMLGALAITLAAGCGHGHRDADGGTPDALLGDVHLHRHRLPLVVGLVWTLGLMHLFEVSFNLANIWGLPLIIGTSAEFGLNVMLRYLEGRAHGGPLLARSTVKAVALNGIIMMGGFGSLMIAAHCGVFGLGLLLTIGSACGALASLIVLPVLLKLLSRRGAPDVDAVGHRSAA
jgi:uncharacterized membrane protein YdfJ with MMPL/SSD domain